MYSWIAHHVLGWLHMRELGHCFCLTPGCYDFIVLFAGLRVKQLIIKCKTTGLTGEKNQITQKKKYVHDTTPQPVSFYIKIIAPQCVPLIPLLVTYFIIQYSI